MSMIEVTQLTKSFDKGRVTALRGIDLQVESGELYGIIGPDGAGKTTMLRLLASLLKPDGGTATVCGYDVIRQPQQVHQVLGYMPEQFSLYADLTAEENLNFFAALYKTTVEKNYDRIANIYKLLVPFKNRRAGKLSGGMKQKLALCCALIHAPQILLLDEPTTGVDPVSRKEFWENLQRLKKEGLTVLVSTPYMDEALQCDRIALMQHGRFLQVDTPQNMIHTYNGILWAVRARQMHRLLADLRACEEVVSAYSFGENVHVQVKPLLEMNYLEERLRDCGHEDIQIVPIAATIEDCFMKLMQKNE